MTTTNTAADTNSSQTMHFGIENETANFHREIAARVGQRMEQKPITNRLVIRSARDAAIITGHWTPGLEQELTRMCVGKSDVDGVQEYWGDTDTGDHWHVVLE